MTRHAAVTLLALVLLAVGMRACAVPAGGGASGHKLYLPLAIQGAPRCNRFRADDWLPCVLATLTTEAQVSSTPTATLRPWTSATPLPWPTLGPRTFSMPFLRWDDRVTPPGAVPGGRGSGTPTRSPSPTGTRRARPTRAHGTPTPTDDGKRGDHPPPPTCGPGTVPPPTVMRGTPTEDLPECWPWGGTFTSTPGPTDTPPASATPEPTPTPRPAIEPAPTPAATLTPFEQSGATRDPVYRYRFPMILVRSRLPRGVR